MSRLLLVDDNPSIHRIAESLLAPTDIELVCVDSAAEALDRIARGERFDVALVDTAMPGMDGWTLLQRLRAMEETALMPIALMAGVLDPVDPAKLAKAPIQGFLKKPIELRELGDRVKALLATPVIPPPSPFSTMPATPARDLLSRAEIPLPEFRSEALTESPIEDDLLILTAEDLWPEEAPIVTVPEVPEEVATYPTSASEVHLELEELDLESLQDLSEAFLGEPEPEPEPEPELEPEPEPEPEPELKLDLELGPMADEGLAPELEPAPEPVSEAAPLPEAAEDSLEESFTAFPDLDVLDSLPADWSLPEGLGDSLAADLGEPVVPEQAEPGSEPAPLADILPDAEGQAAAAPSPVPAVSPELVQAFLQALQSDPSLMDALAKAVVARLGDQVLREIAWEIMPELAGRLQSQAHDPS